MSKVCCLGHIAQTCTAVLYGSTPRLVVLIKKLKASYNGVLRRLLLLQVLVKCLSHIISHHFTMTS